MSKVKIDSTFTSHVSGLRCLMSQSIFPNISMKTQQPKTNDLNQAFSDEHQHGYTFLRVAFLVDTNFVPSICLCLALHVSKGTFPGGFLPNLSRLLRGQLDALLVGGFTSVCGRSLLSSSGADDTWTYPFLIFFVCARGEDIFKENISDHLNVRIHVNS